LKAVLDEAVVEKEKKRGEEMLERRNAEKKGKVLRWKGM